MQQETTYRYWHADCALKADEKLGIQVTPDPAGLIVSQVCDSGAVFAWNKRCLQTFPPDEIREGDVIISINGVGYGEEPRQEKMVAILNYSNTLFLEMRRCVKEDS